MDGGREGYMSKRRKKQKICDPAMCDECMYLGEGDFVCTLHGLGPDLTVFVIEGWETTEHYLQCGKAANT